jgi:type IV secretion system protein VirB6
MTCAPADTSQLVAERLANYLDCQAQSLGANGFANLAGGWFGPALLWGCLTIYVALIGYRLIFGEPFGPREAVLATLRAGVVIAFATSWSAYETVIYRVVNDGPAEVASLLLSSDASAPSLPEAAQRLDEDYASLQAGEVVALPPPDPPPQTNPPATSGTLAQGPQAPSRPDPMLDHAGFVLAVVMIGSLGALQLAGGLLLGIGPVFITLGLFDVTLGVLVGWGRALLGVFVAVTGGMCLTALELGFIEAQLPAAELSFAGQSPLGEPTLMALAVLFAIAMALVLIVAFAVGCSLRLPLPPERLTSQPVGSDAGQRRDFAPLSVVDTFAFGTLGRAQTVADAVRRIGERESAVDPAWASATRIAALQSLGGAGAAGRLSVAGPVTIGRESPESRRRLTRAPTPSVERRERL